MSEQKTKGQGFFSKLALENPVFATYLGICSTLAITTTLNSAIGMGVAVIVVLTLSNIVVSLIAPITPDDIHIPVYIVIIASLVTIVSMFMHAYTPSLFTALGAFLDLVVVNCIILGRAEAYACKHSVLDSMRDGLQQGFAYTLALLAMSFIRQLLGTGVLSFSNPFTNTLVFSLRLIPEGFEMPMFVEQFGAFITFACLAAAVTAYKNHLAKPAKKGAAK